MQDAIDQSQSESFVGRGSEVAVFRGHVGLPRRDWRHGMRAAVLRGLGRGEEAVVVTRKALSSLCGASVSRRRGATR
ncbi:hypothetical protein [Lentzea nigeriaca]|uniref:hypothetical protein n=1 Tax=Lentzea nigeriaca TaxID=1128665 RepID=UPI00195CAF48|nr:hypothetical protein [Lentzea nigeriaca]MBM7862677.1 hypothetical protein [Lentzea nigeriaca]